MELCGNHGKFDPNKNHWKVLSETPGSQFWVSGGLGGRCLGQLASMMVDDVLETFGWTWKHAPPTSPEVLSETAVRRCFG